MRLVLLSCVPILFAFLTGCGASTKSVDSEAGQSLLDSLRTEVIRLQDRNRTLRDSLQFYDDIESGQYHRDMRSLEDQLARLTYEVRMLRDGGQTVSILSADSLFATGVDSISTYGAKRLKALARKLQRTYPNRSIQVEGHTDNTPLGDSLRKRFPSNWALSSARATVVVRRLIELTDLAPDQFIAVGYGPSRPRTSNDTRTGRRRNRRVRIGVLPPVQSQPHPLDTSW